MKVIVRFAVELTDKERAALNVRTRRDVKDDLTRRASALLRSDLEELVRVGEREHWHTCCLCDAKRRCRDYECSDDPYHPCAPCKAGAVISIA